MNIFSRRSHIAVPSRPALEYGHNNGHHVPADGCSRLRGSVWHVHVHTDRRGRMTITAQRSCNGRLSFDSSIWTDYCLRTFWTWRRSLRHPKPHQAASAIDACWAWCDRRTAADAQREAKRKTARGLAKSLSTPNVSDSAAHQDIWSAHSR